MSWKKVLVVLFVLGACAAIVGYRMYTVKVPVASERTTEVTVDATDLFNAFSVDEIAAGKLYNDKVVQVNGVVGNVSRSEAGRVRVSLNTGDAMGAVVCEFQSVAEEPVVGDTVSIKGFCAGFNMDVLLQRCAIENEH